MSMTDNELNKLYRVSGTIMICCLFVSMLVHEIGHVIGFRLLGIHSTITFAIYDIGPAFVTQALVSPSASEILFTAAVGPIFGAIVFGLLGKFWKMECYVAAVFQLIYALFELSSMVLGTQFEVWFLFIGFVVTAPPTILVMNRIFLRRVKERSD